MYRYPAILNLGFRLFFFSATVFAVFTMLIWLSLYSYPSTWNTGTLPPTWWHGHEMIYGYAAAVVTGFLFTAVQNWTGVAMPHGWLLLLYWLPWCIARLLFIFAPNAYLIAASLDLLFAIGGFYGVLKPVIAVKQWRQMGIVSKMFLIIIGHLLFVAGLLGLSRGIYWSLYLGVFTILAIVLTIGRRVTPFFIERGVGYPFTPKNSVLIDRLCLLTFLIFFILKIFTPWTNVANITALLCAICNTWRLIGWHTKGIWRKPLLWSMFLAFTGMILGFILYSCQLFYPVTDSLALHALTLSGIGLLTLSMMGRVSLGHSGRNIHQPPRLLIIGLYLLGGACVFRVALPLLFPNQYSVWIIHAQILWILAFLLLLIAYTHIWFSPRIDGKAG
ncbi:MAG: NnrS family protein [Cardiobacteriaceae bacterium]|nr:NnrS family protein [Cardiobacteriaceae bacterium]